MYDDILIATDGREEMMDVIEEALELATLCDATIHGLYVVGNQGDHGITGAKWLTFSEVADTTGEQAVADIEERAQQAGIEVRTAIGQGAPDKRVRDYAGKNGIDLVVIGTHGRSGLNRLLTGSVTEDIIRETNVPVQVLRYGADRSNGKREVGSRTSS